MIPRKRIELKEYEPYRLHRKELSDDTAMRLCQQYSRQINVEWPTFRTENCWQLTAQGWVGHIPLGPDLEIVIAPKVPIRSLFGMLEYAYRLKGFEILDGLTDCESLKDFYETLAGILASKVNDQLGRGLYRSYVGHDDQLSYVRGRINIMDSLRRVANPRLPCRYQEHTADISDNRIPLWALQRIAYSGLCTERVLPKIRNTYRALLSHITPSPYYGKDCIGRTYNPLNEDYRTIHALCRFFLESVGPGVESGAYEMLPFLINMSQLFELFVAEWLKIHAPEYLEIKAKEEYTLGSDRKLNYQVDLVIRDLRDGEVKCVIDTKYKDPADGTPESADVHQVLHYAVGKDSPAAILLYPRGSGPVHIGESGPVRIFQMAFHLDENIEAAGSTFLNTLLKIVFYC